MKQAVRHHSALSHGHFREGKMGLPGVMVTSEKARWACLGASRPL